MNILFVNSFFYPEEQTSGPVVQCLDLARALAARHGIRVFCGTRKTAARQPFLAEEERCGLPVAVYTRSRGAGRAVRYAQLRSAQLEACFRLYLQRHRPDIVHFHTLHQSLCASLPRVAAAMRIPAVTGVYESWWLCPATFAYRKQERRICEAAGFASCLRCYSRDDAGRFRAGRCLKNIPYLFHRRRFLKGVLRAADGLIFPSRFLAQRYAEAGISRTRMAVVNYGVDRQSAGMRPRGTAGSRPDRPLRLGFVNGTVALKGFEVLLEALARLPGELFTLQVWGPLDEPGRERLRRACPGSRIVIRGVFGRAQLQEVFDSMDALLFPSLLPENYPLSVLEAQACGVPVIASAAGGIPEIVRDGENGLLFPAGDAQGLAACVRRIAQETGLRSRLAGGIRPVKGIEEQAVETEEVYARAIGLHRRTG